MTGILAEPRVEVLADHSVLLAIPAFAPALIVVGVVVWIAMKDRRNAEDEDDDERASREDSAAADKDGYP
jgi:cytochrome c-type biogenesis protein CcmH/NrfF